ncbi:MAG TPA: hypothetical protein VF588_00400 [Pyrinomonadaceae bacterium]|jgi:hypothetical protein
MPVIINEFEVMVEPPPERQTRSILDEGQAPPPPAPSKMKPEEINAVACVNRERMERVRAD